MSCHPIRNAELTNRTIKLPLSAQSQPPPPVLMWCLEKIELFCSHCSYKYNSIQIRCSSLLELYGFVLQVLSSFLLSYLLNRYYIIYCYPLCIIVLLAYWVAQVGVLCTSCYIVIWGLMAGAGQYLCQYWELFAGELQAEDDWSVNQVGILELGPLPGDTLDQSLIPRSFDNL